jgi:hypothetical protein
MTTAQMDELVEEIRADFQIPPYQSDETIERAVTKCYARLAFLQGIEFDPDEDQQGRTLLTNAVYYELNHRYEEFETGWKPNILSWQLGARMPDEDPDDTDPVEDLSEGVYRVTGRADERLTGRD